MKFVYGIFVRSWKKDRTEISFLKGCPKCGELISVDEYKCVCGQRDREMIKERRKKYEEPR